MTEKGEEIARSSLSTSMRSLVYAVPAGIVALVAWVALLALSGNWSTVVYLNLYALALLLLLGVTYSTNELVVHEYGVLVPFHFPAYDMVLGESFVRFEGVKGVKVTDGRVELETKDATYVISPRIVEDTLASTIEKAHADWGERYSLSPGKGEKGGDEGETGPSNGASEGGSEG